MFQGKEFFGMVAFRLDRRSLAHWSYIKNSLPVRRRGNSIIRCVTDYAANTAQISLLTKPRGL